MGKKKSYSQRTQFKKPKKRQPKKLHKRFSRALKRHLKKLMTKDNMAAAYRFFNTHELNKDNIKRGLVRATEHNYNVRLRD